MEKAITSLENHRQEIIFSFGHIKPSLIFFNRDDGLISIISNGDKNGQEYKDLQTKHIGEFKYSKSRET